jgi:hypothetical protein
MSWTRETSPTPRVMRLRHRSIAVSFGRRCARGSTIDGEPAGVGVSD